VVRGCLLVGAYPLKPYMTEAILKQGTPALSNVSFFAQVPCVRVRVRVRVRGGRCGMKS
jgi:hypothetical protein